MAIIKGKWIWNNTNALVEPEGTEWIHDEQVTFTSNGETFHRLCISTEPGTDYIYYGDDMIYEYGWWWSYALGNESYEIYKEMDFGESGVTISDGLYATIAANAIPYIPVDYSTKAINLDQLKLVYDDLKNRIPDISRENIKNILGNKLELISDIGEIGYLQMFSSSFTISNGINADFTVDSDGLARVNGQRLFNEQDFIADAELAAYLGI